MARNLQKERQQRGQEFQDEMRRSWALVKGCWRKRLKDGGGSTEPADELVLLEDLNLLLEHKRTEGDRFELGFLRADQVTGLLNFDRVIARNYGLVCVSFNDPNTGRDDAYAFRFITAMRYMQRKSRVYITAAELAHKALPCARLPRLQGAEKPTYDLGELIACCRSL
ncbi:hypothetical protein [Paenibacillus sp. FSL R5-0908]|uniref:hypothetical protein n=1 Tax=Paenibacillus sp. FSL R5-0908 TaxID=2921664 RepID=UPI0030F56A7B